MNEMRQIDFVCPIFCCSNSNFSCLYFISKDFVVSVVPDVSDGVKENCASRDIKLVWCMIICISLDPFFDVSSAVKKIFFVGGGRSMSK